MIEVRPHHLRNNKRPSACQQYLLSPHSHLYLVAFFPFRLQDLIMHSLFLFEHNYHSHTPYKVNQLIDGQYQQNKAIKSYFVQPIFDCDLNTKHQCNRPLAIQTIGAVQVFSVIYTVSLYQLINKCRSIKEIHRVSLYISQKPLPYCWFNLQQLSSRVSYLIIQTKILELICLLEQYCNQRVQYLIREVEIKTMGGFLLKKRNENGVFWLILNVSQNSKQNIIQANIPKSIFIQVLPLALQYNHMYNQYYLIYPNPFIFPTFPSLPSYPCSLYTYNHLSPYDPPEPSAELENQHILEQESAIKQEEFTEKSETQSKRPSKFKYAKKNVESNVVNQCFSYITTRSKSLSIVSKLLKTQQKISAFYEIMKQGKKKNTKYMGRSVLESLLQLESDHPVYILHKKLRYKVSLRINEIRYALKILINYFLKNLIVPTILTSNKMDKSTIGQHLARARDIHKYLSYNSSHS